LCLFNAPKEDRVAVPPGSRFAVLATLSCTLAAILLTACGPCHFRLLGGVRFPADGAGAVTEVSCCGGAVFLDVNLVLEDQEVDLSNAGSSSGQVDAFLTSATCTKLFDAPYNGTASSALCAILLGPIAPRQVSGRQKLPPGEYRIFAQAWSSNASATRFNIELGIWTDQCRLTPVSP
jgi:hypothetical protein